MRYIIPLFLTLTGCASLPSEKTLVATHNALIVADWLQTREITTNSNYYETNPHLGPHPTTKEVNRYFVGSIVFHNAMTCLIPKKYRQKYLMGQIAYRSYFVGNNISMGIGFKF